MTAPGISSTWRGTAWYVLRNGKLAEKTSKAMRVFLAAAVVIAAVLNSIAARAESFPIDRCAAPPASLGKAGDVDSQCGLAGEASEPEHQAQNTAKNNLCAAANKAIPLTKQDFMRLQKAADQLVTQGRLEYGGPARLPQNRDVLKDLMTLATGAKVGEGSLVSHVGFISHPRNSNKARGESVNCKKGGAEWNDIHFDLMQDPGDDACSSITGELIPHHRAAIYEVPILRLPRISERPIRITGQLFFDGSHFPCRPGGHDSPPLRATVWEVHPVYQIEVCRKTTLAACRRNIASLWVPLEKFVNVVHEDD